MKLGGFTAKCLYSIVLFLAFVNCFSSVLDKFPKKVFPVAAWQRGIWSVDKFAGVNIGQGWGRGVRNDQIVTIQRGHTVRAVRREFRMVD